MANILFTWELGAGLGHVLPYLPVIEALQKKGHRVTFAARDVVSAGRVLARHDVELLAAPIWLHAARSPVERTSTYADVLHNCGYEDPEGLAALLRAWRSLFDLVRPDVVVFDHSPTALLAARAYGFRKIACGTGFFIPPDAYPLPSFRSGERDAAQLKAREDRVTEVINRALAELKTPPLERIGQINETDGVILRTFEELDHYPQREGLSYAGVSFPGQGIAPAWPRGQGPRIFAYLKPFRSLPSLLRGFLRARTPTLVYAPGLDREVIERFRSPSLAFADEPLDIVAVGNECDFAVLQANHDTAAQLLLAGKPAMHVPMTVEQGILAARAEAQGLGVKVAPHLPAQIAAALERFCSGNAPPARAKAFAERYRTHLPEQYVQRFVQAIEV